ncbi:MAG: site-specific integrase [Syntrophobacteraceae bacterium]
MSDKDWRKEKFKSTYPGVYFRKHPTNKHGVRADQYFFLRYKLNGKELEEGIGWASQGHTAREASSILSELKENRRNGTGPVTYREMRHIKEAEAKAEAEERKAEAEQKAEAERKAMPFANIWGQYLGQTKADGKNKNSYEREVSLYTHWIQPVIWNKPLAEIAPIHLEKIKSNMGKAGAAPRSVHYSLAVIRQVFNFATRNELFTGANPVSKVKKPIGDNRRMRFLTQAEAEDILRELQGVPDSRRITLLSLHCGLRFGEIASLTWADVDLVRGTLCIRNASRSDVDGPKKSHTRFAYMTEAVKAEFSNMEPSNKADLVFPDRKGNRRKQMSDAFDRAVERLGFNEGINDRRQQVCFHTCRHSFASWLVEGGTSLFTVKEMLGHKTLAMTERYSHLQPETLQRAVNELDRQLKRGNAIELQNPQSA